MTVIVFYGKCDTKQDFDSPAQCYAYLASRRIAGHRQSDTHKLIVIIASLA